VSLFDTGLITMQVVAAAGTFTRSAGGSGSFLTDGFVARAPVRFSGFTNAGNNADKVPSVVTATVITVPTAGLVNEGPLGSPRVVSCDGELPLNPTAGQGMYAQARQRVVLGYARRVNFPGNQYDLTGGWGRPGVLNQVPMGSAGVAFGYGPAGKRTDVGTPAQPCQLQNAPGRTLTIVPLSAGAHTISIDARWYPDSGEGRRPRLTTPRDLDMGIQDDMISADPGAGGGLVFVTLSLSVTVSQDGAIAVYREQQDQRADAWTLWDNLQVT